MILVLGEILFDVFPRQKRLGGAPFNCAYHLYRLGLPLRFASRVGSDPEGRTILALLQKYGFPCEDIQRDPEAPTGKVMVAVDPQGLPSYTILPAVAYDYWETTPAIEDFLQRECRLVYFGSLIQRSAKGCATVQRLLQARPPEVKTLYDVNLRPDGFSRTILEQSLRQTDILKLNAEELDILAGLFVPNLAPTERLSGLATLFNLEMVALTRGAEGSTLFTADALYHARPQRGVKIRDTVGAGDAYAAMLAAGVVLRWPAQTILRLADRLAAKICGIEGAIPEDPAFYADIDAHRIRERAHG